jgi:DnaJ-class molecular chaperone
MTVAAVILLAAAVWLGSLYVRPFGRCQRCHGAGTVRRGRRRVIVCPRCHGQRRGQRFGSRALHRAIRKIRQGRQAAARYQQQGDSDGTP